MYNKLFQFLKYTKKNLKENQMVAIFEQLEAEKARVHNLPDSEFTDAYMGYRRKVEETIKSYTDYLNFMNIPLGNGVAYILLKLIDIFNGTEGSDYTHSRDGLTYTLDPAPFMEMIRIIIEKSRPQHNQKFVQESEITDLSKLKTFASSVVKAIGGYGVSEACSEVLIQRNHSNTGCYQCLQFERSGKY